MPLPDAPLPDPSPPGWSLADRAGLPDPLRALLSDYPRAGWQADPNFGGLVAFWLDRHLSFRRLLDAMTEDAQGLLDGADPQAFGRRLSRLGGHFLGDIHGHHTVEDARFFPLLSAREARLSAGFDLLERDHRDLDAHLAAFADAANGALRALAQPSDLRTQGGLLLGSLATLDRFLDRHLTDEEELVVPVILRDGEGFLA